MTDHSAERALLEHIAQDPDWTKRNAGRISPALFAKEHNRLIFEAICGLDEWDMMSVIGLLRARGNLDKVGGAGEVTDLFVSTTVPSMADWHLERSREDAVLRRCRDTLKDSLEKLEQATRTGVEDASALVAGIVDQLEGAGRLPGKRLGRVSIAEALTQVVDGIESRSKSGNSLPGLTTGFPLLDQKTFGLQPGHLWVLAGLPGEGKSTLMQNICEAAIREGAKLGCYQLEMPIEEQAFRLLASDSKVDSGKLWVGTITHAEKMQIAASMQILKDCGAEFLDTDGVDANSILADIEASDYRVVMLDYLQLLEATPVKGETREQVISNFARRLKNIAKAKGMTILTGSQLNDDGKLRESRSIGQHSDKVISIGKPDDCEDDEDDRRVLRGVKNRGGPRGFKIDMQFLGSIYTFRERGKVY